jgi:starvation-inducible DNA-binding protein
MSNYGLSQETMIFVANNINALLADLYVYQAKLLKFHWNVKGSHFGPLHQLFESGYKLVVPLIDDSAERVVQLNGKAFGTLTEFLKYSRIVEHPGVNPGAEHMIKELVSDCDVIICHIRELVNHTDSTYRDMGTNNFLCDMMQKLEKYRWFLNAHLCKE